MLSQTTMFAIRQSYCLRRCSHVHILGRAFAFRRGNHSTDASKVDYSSKYADKLRRIASEKGVSLDDLRARARKEARERERERSREISSRSGDITNTSNLSRSPTQKLALPDSSSAVRQDSSPIKPLSTILNIPRLLETPHTTSQIASLWTAYHATRSGGTGRGYVCATVPLNLYEMMISTAELYSSFVVPLPRKQMEKEADEPNQSAYEFFFLQWAFHGSPPPPSRSEPDPFSPNASLVFNPGEPPSPPIATILFTPLLEYKLRNSFATPYLVLTLYTDLARSHGVVLLRGELTPSAAGTSSADSHYHLSQEDAQFLTMILQKFYLWQQGEEKDGRILLKTFHEAPDSFKWEELLRHANLT